ncbi:hypothetical protein QPL79_07985 [Ignisphaera sp. 4213-co]|uniref:HTH marR-type domain-containing protein n=1 Tax=Ignisphaera cupida TaxID=3050454 RepID=A0ABD4Z9B7_9CREN|nr:hypothetical protein [Ignisphaera sp. 4213-co]MDK6029299.1 hypothetical protein [Ignisphaera sp. 4213-co]
MPEKQQTQQQKTKELKVFSTQVVTIDAIRNDRRKLTLLYMIKTLNSVSEKGLTHLITILNDEKGVNLGYTIVKLGNRIIVRELLEDIKALLYVGLIETDPKTKKLQLTSKGKEFLETIQTVDKKLSEILGTVEELKTKVVAIDEEVATATQIMQQIRKR